MVSLQQRGPSDITLTELFSSLLLIALTNHVLMKLKLVCEMVFLSVLWNLKSIIKQKAENLIKLTLQAHFRSLNVGF